METKIFYNYEKACAFCDKTDGQIQWSSDKGKPYWTVWFTPTGKYDDAKQKPRKGHWIKMAPHHPLDIIDYKCSECGRLVHNNEPRLDDGKLLSKFTVTTQYPYCHCGAEMVEVEENE